MGQRGNQTDRWENRPGRALVTPASGNGGRVARPSPRSEQESAKPAAAGRLDLPVIGWREWVALPDFGVRGIKVKVDTGARTSALHAFRLEVLEDVDGPIAHFEIHPEQRRATGAVAVKSPIVGWRRVRSSNGDLQERPVIRTLLGLGEACWAAELTLTNRDEMGFRMLLGRAAIRHRYVVDPGHSFLAPRRSRR